MRAPDHGWCVALRQVGVGAGLIQLEAGECGVDNPALPDDHGHAPMLDLRVIFMDVAVGRWGLPSVEMETLLWSSLNPV